MADYVGRAPAPARREAHLIRDRESPGGSSPLRLIDEMDPEWTGPGELAVLLLDADIVPAQSGRPFLLVDPFEFDLGAVRLGREDVLEVLDHVDLRDRGGADRADLDPDGTVGAELVAHDVVARADVEHD